MNQPGAPVEKDLVLIGGGHSHVAVLKMFGMNPPPGVRITLISRDSWTPYSGMLPGLIAGHYTFEEAHIDLRPLCRFANARFINAQVTGLDLKEKRVLLKDRTPLGFDVLSINTGSSPRIADVPGAAKHALPIKPIDRFLDGWERIAREIGSRVRSSHQPRLRVIVVGGGAGGVELLLCCQYRLGQTFKGEVEWHLATASEVILPTHNRGTQKKFERILRERGVQTHLGHKVIEVLEREIICEGGKSVPFDFLFWVTSAAAPPWLKDLGLQLDSDGFIQVNDYLQSLSHSFVFAAGDIAAVVNHPRAKSGVFAVRQGKPLTLNLRAGLAGEPLRPFQPQREFLSIISTGDKCAVASRSWWSVEGKRVWKVKDWIDRRWMRKYQDLPAMHEPTERRAGDSAALPGEHAFGMRCGGCGAKIGSTVLSRVLDRLQIASVENVHLGIEARDDAAVISVPAGKVAVQSVDYFRAFLDDPYVFAKVAANHCLNDIYAKGADPHSALAIATIPFAPERVIERDLWQLLSGAVDVLNANGAALLGGHSSEGAELALGLTVNGFVDPNRILRKGGMQVGDALILTKALGTGTLFAAEMRGKARGDWIQAAIDSMLLDGRDAMRCLTGHGAHACTDVTGFGLMGHLVEMLKASGMRAEISLKNIPLLAGVAETLAERIVSSLQPENLRSQQAIDNLEQAAKLPMYAILFDPQTAGGFLASVPESHAAQCVADLQKAGYASACVVGRVSAEKKGAGLVAIL